MRLPVKFPRLNNMSICMVFAHIQRNRNGCKQNFETFDLFADVYIFFLDISSIFPRYFLIISCCVSIRFSPLGKISMRTTVLGCKLVNMAGFTLICQNICIAYVHSYHKLPLSYSFIVVV